MSQTSSITRRMLVAGATALAALAGSALAVPSPASAQDTLEQARERGFIRVGFANEAPYGFATPDGKLTGESPEVAKAVLARLGINEVDGVLTEFGSLIPGLMAGRFDMVAAGMFITPARCQQVAFSEPSYGIGQAFLVAEGNPHGIADYSSIAENSDLTLAVMAGAVEAGYASDAGVPDSQILVLPDQSSLLSAVRAGRADAAALTAPSIAEMAQQSGVESTAAVRRSGRPVGHGPRRVRLPQGGHRPARGLQRRTEEFIGSQEHIALVTPFGFGEGYLPNRTTEDLCTE
jgi:polar amino acid transport system substrate-binding protein